MRAGNEAASVISTLIMIIISRYCHLEGFIVLLIHLRLMITNCNPITSQILNAMFRLVPHVRITEYMNI